MVANNTVVPGLVAVKLGMLPLPLPPKPIAVLLFDQLYVVPVTAPLKLTRLLEAPEQSVWFDGAFTVGVGFTVIVKFCGVPAQVAPALVYDGVTVMVAVIGVVPALVTVKLGMLPLPLAPKPIAVFVFDQL